MPHSAIHSGNADLILKPGEMPQEIIQYTDDTSGNLDPEFDEKQLEIIFGLIHQEVGHDFHYYKLPTINRRIARRMSQLNIDTIDNYITLLQRDKDEARQLGKDFLIGVTRFFRDQEAFDMLRTETVPELLNNKAEGGTVKAWICACSTGEEAYSMAMLMSEAVELSGKQLDLKIFATDIDEASIAIATRGVYPASIEKDVPADFLEKYFIRSNSQFQVVPSIRKLIVFARHDVIKDPPFINNDIVSCRNMLIYMSPVLQQKVMSVLSFSILQGGILFLGSSESSALIRDSVTEISAKHKIYRKTGESRMGPQYLSAVSNRRVTDFERETTRFLQCGRSQGSYGKR